jgi:hypothetical protein
VNPRESGYAAATLSKGRPLPEACGKPLAEKAGSFTHEADCITECNAGPVPRQAPVLMLGGE